MSAVLISWGHPMHPTFYEILFRWAMFLPGYIAYWFCFELALLLDLPQLWDRKIIIGGIVGWVAAYPWTYSYEAAWGLSGTFVPHYTAFSVGYMVAVSVLMFQIFMETTWGLDPPGELADVPARFRGQRYQE